jgi:hypothetical protein
LGQQFFYEKNVGTRLDDLKAKLCLNWGELAAHLSISRSMLDFLRTGHRDPSAKTMRRLIEAEREAGIVTLEPETQSQNPKQLEYEIPSNGESICVREEMASGFLAITKSIQSLQTEIEKLRLEIVRMQNKKKEE